MSCRNNELHWVLSKVDHLIPITEIDGKIYAHRGHGFCWGPLSDEQATFIFTELEKLDNGINYNSYDSLRKRIGSI